MSKAKSDSSLVPLEFPRASRAIIDGETLAVFASQLAEDLLGLGAGHAFWLGRRNHDDQYATLFGAGRMNPLPLPDLTLERTIAQAVADGGHAVLPSDHPTLQSWQADLDANDVGVVACICSVSSLRPWLVALILIPGRGGASESGPDPLVISGAVLRLLERAATHEMNNLVVSAVSAAGNSMFLTDAEGRIVWINSAFTELTGYEAREVVGRNPRFLKSGRQGKRYYKQLWQTINAGRVWSNETVDKDKYGYQYVIAQTISPLMKGHKASHFLSVHDDVSRKRALKVEEERASRIDHRTGLLNSTAFRDQLVESTDRARRGDGGFALVSLWLHGIGSELDSYGPDMSSHVLEQVALRIRKVLGENDVGGFMGRSDFGLLLHSISRRDEAEELIENIKLLLKDPMPLIGDVLALAPRYGVALCPQDGDDPDQLWRLADDAMIGATDA